MTPIPFSQVSAIEEIFPGRFSAEVSPRWTVGGHPSGGYLVAMLGAAAAATGAHPHVIASSAHFLRSPEPGPVTIDVSILRVGRNMTQLRSRLLQAGTCCVEATITTSELQMETKPYWDGGLPERSAVDATDCRYVPGVTPTGERVTMFENAELRLEAGSVGFLAGRPSGAGELRGWLRMPRDEPFDPASLLWAVDAFPPASFDVEISGWVPTLQITSYIRALPAPGPVQVLQRAQLIDAQRVDQTCYVWDSTGRLVAQSLQLAAVRLGHQQAGQQESGD